MTVDVSSLMRLLSSNAVKVTFTKVDGTVREMWCTRDPSLIPEQAQNQTPASAVAERKVNESVVAVWDMDNEGWRSFRKDSVTSFDARMKASA
jgi:hypothetical protein